MGNGGYATYHLHSRMTTTTTGGGRSRRTVYNLQRIGGSNQWIAKFANVSNKDMTVKINYVFGTDTDDGTRFGLWYALDHYQKAFDGTFNAYTASWKQLENPSTNRGNGWGGARYNISKMYNRVSKSNVVIKVPAGKSCFFRAMGHITGGSSQYESVGLKSFSIHSPKWG